MNSQSLWFREGAKTTAEPLLWRRAIQQSLKTPYGCTFSEGAWLATCSQQLNEWVIATLSQVQSRQGVTAQTPFIESYSSFGINEKQISSDSFT